MSDSYKNLIHRCIPALLSSVPFHRDSAYIQRYFSEDFPCHLAIHQITGAKYETQEQYTDPHTHDVDEINIIIGDEEGLEYAIQLGDEVFRVNAPISVYIPAGLPHAANVLRGSGYFLALRLPERSICSPTEA